MLNDARTHLEIRSTTDSIWKSRLMPVLVIVLFIAAIASFFFGKYSAQVQWQNAVQALNVLEEEHSAALRENTRLKEGLEFEKAKSSRDLQIKRKAYDEVAQTLAISSKEIATLKENVRFYESVIEGDEKKQGLQIKTVSLYEDGTAGHYRYKVIVVNSNFGKNKSKGKLAIELEGMQNGELQTIKIPGSKSNTSSSLLFKYFQRVDGLLVVPDGFKPQRVHVTASLTSGKGVKNEKWYNWSILLNRAMSDQESDQD
jgi:hypothetical protein